MTVTADPEAEAPTAEVPAVDGRRTHRRPAELARRGGALSFVALVVLLIAVFLVEDPLAHVWYQVRQQHLTSTFATARPIHDGDPVAVIQIPAQGINVTVVQGDGPGALRGGPAHRPGSPLPGQRGNSIIFGHDSSWGGPFQDLSQLKVGNNIFVQPRTANGPGLAYFFRVSSTEVVPSDDVRPFATSNDFRLTLVTGASSGGRLIVQAISGTAGRLAAPGPHTSASTGAVAPALTWPIVGLAAFSAGLLVLLRLRRGRPSGTAGLIVATPLALGLLLCLILIGDTVFRSPLS